MPPGVIHLSQCDTGGCKCGLILTSGDVRVFPWLDGSISGNGWSWRAGRAALGADAGNIAGEVVAAFQAESATRPSQPSNQGPHQRHRRPAPACNKEQPMRHGHTADEAVSKRNPDMNKQSIDEHWWPRHPFRARSSYFSPEPYSALSAIVSKWLEWLVRVNLPRANPSLPRSEVEAISRVRIVKVRRKRHQTRRAIFPRTGVSVIDGEGSVAADPRHGDHSPREPEENHGQQAKPCSKTTFHVGILLTPRTVTLPRLDSFNAPARAGA